ncbi:MAG: ornithine carbamoyltransferase, partial [Rhodospirillaceae bacterium]
MSTSPKHFLDLDVMAPETLRKIIDDAAALKSRASATEKPLAGKTLAMVFEKPSTRTRVSFQVGMLQLGGAVTTLSPKDTQLGRGESIADTARVLSRYVDAIMLRTTAAANLRELARHATVPVINGLTDDSHP